MLQVLFPPGYFDRGKIRNIYHELLASNMKVIQSFFFFAGKIKDGPRIMYSMQCNELAAVHSYGKRVREIFDPSVGARMDHVLNTSFAQLIHQNRWPQLSAQEQQHLNTFKL